MLTNVYLFRSILPTHSSSMIQHTAFPLREMPIGHHRYRHIYVGSLQHNHIITKTISHSDPVDNNRMCITANQLMTRLLLRHWQVDWVTLAAALDIFQLFKQTVSCQVA